MTNQIAVNERLRARMSAEIVRQSMDFFTNHHRSTANHQMSLKSMPYLLKIYLDASPEIYVMSSVQTGKSEWALIKGFACVKLGLNVFHVFSTGEAKGSFVKSRINDLCDRVPVYMEMENDVKRNTYLRSIGKANWKFVLSGSRPQFDEFPADVVIVDEYDSCNQENVPLAETRLENSPYKFRWYIGNPTVMNMGISKFFDGTTQNEWFFICSGCGKLIPADFYKVVVYEESDKDGNHVRYKLYDREWREDLQRDIMIRCPHCELMQDRGPGRWEVMNPTGLVSGYHISKMMKLNSMIKELWKEVEESDGNDFKMQIFSNKKLGVPFSGAGSKVTGEMLEGCTYEYKTKDSSTRETIAGLDIGSKFDMQIVMSVKHGGQRKRLLVNAFRLNSEQEVIDKICEFKVKTMCVGVKPERHLVKGLREQMFGTCDILLVEEVEGRSGNLKLQGFKEDFDNGVITVDRTWMLDESLKNIKHKKLIVPSNFRYMLDGYWLKSMESITRIFQNEKEEYKWSKADHDHFRFADAFSMLAWMLNQGAIICGDEIQEGERDDTRMGASEGRGKSIGIMRQRFGLRKPSYRRREGRVQEENS